MLSGPVESGGSGTTRLISPRTANWAVSDSKDTVENENNTRRALPGRTWWRVLSARPPALKFSSTVFSVNLLPLESRPLTRATHGPHNLLEALRVAAQLLSPFLPEACVKIFALLSLPAEQLRAYDLPWGKAFPPGHRVQKPQPLFPRLA